MSNLDLYQKLGSQLISKGKWFLNKSTKVKKTTFTPEEIRNKIQDITGIFPVLYDEKYHTTDIGTWTKIIKNDWTNKKEWTEDTFDCDNFSNAFCAYCADIYGLNTAGRFTCELLDPETDKHIGYHRAVVIIDSKLDVWLLESQNDGIVKMKKDKLPVIKKWKYKGSFIGIN